MYRDSGDSGALRTLAQPHIPTSLCQRPLGVGSVEMRFLIEGTKKADTLKLKLPGL